ncbi:SH3 domain-containing protein [Streptomyces sp. NPDC005574]|uniref:SH3 domain-containing protein n=1 Tax=Streptomyces sp. NPDC005574 TaxID=3156891 RepID=UPI0033B3E258
MRTTVALRAVAAALLAGGGLVAAGAGTSASAATAPSYAEGNGDGGSGSVPGTVVSGTALHVRAEPTTRSATVDRLAPGSQDRVQCKVRGQRVEGNPYWYWLVGAQGWASAAFVDTGGTRVAPCADPCPQWKNGSWSNADHNDPAWSRPWAVSGSFSWSFSGSWNFTVASGASSDGWGTLPVVW